MRLSNNRLTFLLLLFCGTLCSAMIVPFMGFFLVEGLGYEPWIISVYSVMAVGLTLWVNRQFAGRIDAGTAAFPLVGYAVAGFLCAVGCLWLSPTLWAALSVGVLGFGLGSSATSTMFSIGGILAEQLDVPRSQFNAHMRATTSTAWMVGPAVTFLIADQLSIEAVFLVALLIAALWGALWWLTLPRDIAANPKPSTVTNQDSDNLNRGLWLAAAFVFCLSFAHSITFSSLPLFYVQEVGLPGYAPGLAFSMKTFVEVIAIFSTPWIIARVGIRKALLGTTLLAVLTIQILAMVQTFPQMLFGEALEGLYYGFYASLGISYVQSFSEDRPARATAIYWNAMMVSGVLAGPVVGSVAQVFDFQTAIRIASIAALVALAVLLMGRERRTQHA